MPPPIRIQTPRDRALSELERDRWEDILRGLTAERAAVKAGMVFALDHAEAAAEVVEVLQVRGPGRPWSVGRSSRAHPGLRALLLLHPG